MDDHFCLKWNNHCTAFLNSIKNIRIKERYCDATIVCQGTYFSVHRIVLSTCSEYFEEMFDRMECQHPYIVFKDIEPKEMEMVLNYMYQGEVDVMQAVLPSLIRAAEALRIRGLAVPDDLLVAATDESYATRKRSNSGSDNSEPKRNLDEGGINGGSLNEWQSQDGVEDNCEVKYDEDAGGKGEPLISMECGSSEEAPDDSGPVSPLPRDTSLPLFPGDSANEDESGFEGFPRDSVVAEDVFVDELSAMDDNRDRLAAQPASHVHSSSPIGRKCPYCKYKSVSTMHVKRHILYRHTAERPFSCTVCTKKFVEKIEQQRHMATHTAEKPFQCYRCDKKFCRKFSLGTHMRNVHNSGC